MCYRPQAAEELGIPSGTIYAWVKAFKEGRLEAENAVHTPGNDICSEDECNDTYGRVRMHQALILRQPDGIKVPSERTVYRVMDEIGISHRPKRKPNAKIQKRSNHCM